MAVWLVRAGGHGEYEQKFLTENRVYLTWDGLDTNLRSLPDRESLKAELNRLYPNSSAGRITNWASQIAPFADGMQEGDWVVVPLKRQPAVAIGVLEGGYQHNPEGPDPFYHYRSVRWLNQEIPRSRFSQDILYSFGAFMTICRIARNRAEERIKAMAENNWQPESDRAIVNQQRNDGTADEASDSDIETNLEELANAQIVRLIEAKFRGHELTRLITAILKAQGYTVRQSPEGADGGVDILACNGPMGFGDQKICVEVKSGDSPVDRPTVDKLIGATKKFRANQGLFVSWGGFKSTVEKELAASFFDLRLWTQTEVLEQLFLYYDKLDDDIKAELPLQRIWIATLQE